jgi:hypothetical protein
MSGSAAADGPFGGAASSDDRQCHLPYRVPVRHSRQRQQLIEQGIHMNRRQLFLSTAKAALVTAFGGSSLFNGTKARTPAPAGSAAAAAGRQIQGTSGSPDATTTIGAIFRRHHSRSGGRLG